MAQADDFDVVVVGSGAGGLSAAITARHAGLRVVVVEKADLIGGTTALSGGVLWVPGNPLAQGLGIQDSAESAERYLRHEASTSFDEETVRAFLDNGPAMVRFFQEHTLLRFEAAAKFPDYHSDAPGAGQGGRSLRVMPFDGRQLGKQLGLIRMPLPETRIFGTMTVSGNEVNHFFQVSRSLASFWYVTKLVLRHFAQTLLHSRGMRLTNGNALAARLAQAAFDMGIPIRLSSSVQSLVVEQGRVTGVRIATDGAEQVLRAGKGVVLACGGFPHDIESRRALFPHDPTGREHCSPAPAGNTGDGIRLGVAVGAQKVQDLPNAAAWVPVSKVPRRDGGVGLFPHFFERSKPGVIAVTRAGKRFANESGSYHDMMQALVGACGDGEKTAFLVCDRAAIRRYGLGFAKPMPFPLWPNLRSGYLRRGWTIGELARNTGIDAAMLERTISEFNVHARTGTDAEFARGSTAYNRAMGDPLHGPNPCLAPLEQGPFYAVQIFIGDLGTFAGLRTNGKAQVLGVQGEPIPGLYAAGNDMSSIMGGNYPAAGITLGPAMTFGFVAGRELAL